MNKYSMIMTTIATRFSLYTYTTDIADNYYFYVNTVPL